MDYGEPTWDKVPEEFIILGDNVSIGLSDQVFMAEDVAKCFCCGGWFPLESCVVNHDEEHKAVPVCETCAEGRVGERPPSLGRSPPFLKGESPRRDGGSGGC